MVLDELADQTLFVIAVAEDTRTNRANLHASRLQALSDAVIAPCAFVCYALLLIEITRAIRTGLHAVLAADAIGVIDEDHAILGLIGRAGRAHLHAGGVRAVIA